MAQEPPLDEIQWRSPKAQEMGGIHTNTVLPYFAESPFFDATSNNAALTTQAFHNASMFYIIQTREAFEGRLRTMQGLEFMVTHDPSENDTKPNNSGVWVIRKQHRRKRQGAQDEVTGISSYYVVGENVYMAPSVTNILSSRLLSTVTSLTKLLSTASSLPSFTPSLGHVYLPPVTRNPTSASSFQATQTSKEGTPMLGGGTPLPAAQENAGSTKVSKSTSDVGLHGVHMLELSYDLADRFGNEYMDENPLVGEPGAFKLSKSHHTSFATSMTTSKTSSQSVRVPTPVKSAVPTPQLKTEDLPAPPRKATKGSEKSPTTPSTKEKKSRRKSKAAGDRAGATPKATTPKPSTPG
ncbi:MED6 mediator subfamily complex component-domain-containing protein [Usnea florida]